GKRSGFHQEELLAVASQIGNFKERDAMDIIEQCTDVVSRWRSMASENAVPAALVDEIEASLRLDLAGQAAV
ncbi:unnamed protein product, partial [Laminaria digitata]